MSARVSTMTYVLIRNGIVVHCVSVDDLNSLSECYPDCVIRQRVANENIGWSFDGVNFTAPAG